MSETEKMQRAYCTLLRGALSPQPVSARLAYVLQHEGVEPTVHGFRKWILDRSERSIYRTPNCGQATLKEIRGLGEHVGLELRYCPTRQQRAR